jgi:hypothetical protein
MPPSAFATIAPVDDKRISIVSSLPLRPGPVIRML